MPQSIFLSTHLILRNYSRAHSTRYIMDTKGFRNVIKEPAPQYGWPGISDLETYIKRCPECVKTISVPTKPLLQSPLPKHPWEKVVSDLFEFKGTSYLLVVDYFSRFIEVQNLPQLRTSSAVITALKAIFSHHGVPSVVVSDNGSQYTSEEMKNFATTYGFSQSTSSPHYPRSNGLAKRSVRTVSQFSVNKLTNIWVSLATKQLLSHGVG